MKRVILFVFVYVFCWNTLCYAAAVHVRIPEDSLGEGMPLQLFLTGNGDYRDDVGYSKLSETLGGLLPTGAGVQVSHVEAAVEVDHDNDPDTPLVSAWLPDPSEPNFAGKTILDISGADPLAYSPHATSVGRLFYGNYKSMTPGITLIEAFYAPHWLASDCLDPFAPETLPLSSHSRIFNNSWTGYGFNVEMNMDFLKRVDWLIDTDNAIIVAAMGNGSSNLPLLGSSFNVIAVGRSDGHHGTGSVNIDGLYVSGRTKPDLVAPADYTSAATPMVASAAALLVAKGHQDPSLSHDLQETYTTNRLGDTIYNAERSIVAKAALMAGASKRAINKFSSNITDYFKFADRRSQNGLDSIFGAGQLNIYDSYFIIASGEQNCQENDPVGLGEIGSQGFDYHPGLVGSDSEPGSASYFFTCSNDYQKLSASLVWNIHIDEDGSGDFDGNATLPHFVLSLYETSGPTQTKLASSNSTIDNSQNLWIRLQKGKRYLLKVELDTPGTYDYGLAWNISGFLESDFMGDKDSDGQDLSSFLNYFASQDPMADLNYDGNIDSADIAIFAEEFGAMLSN